MKRLIVALILAMAALVAIAMPPPSTINNTMIISTLATIANDSAPAPAYLAIDPGVAADGDLSFYDIGNFYVASAYCAIGQYVTEPMKSRSVTLFLNEVASSPEGVRLWQITTSAEARRRLQQRFC